jgi:hypothetical protein
MNWEKFKPTLESKTNLKISLKSTNDIDEAVNLLTKSIKQSAWSSSTPTPHINYNGNLPTHVRILITEKRKAPPTWQATKYPSGKHKFNNLTNKLKRLLASIRSGDCTKYRKSLS